MVTDQLRGVVQSNTDKQKHTDNSRSNKDQPDEFGFGDRMVSFVREVCWSLKRGTISVDLSRRTKNA